MNDPVRLVATRPESEIAAELKARIREAMGPVLVLLDEAAALGLHVRWDSLAPPAPFYLKHEIHNLRLERHY